MRLLDSALALALVSPSGPVLRPVIDPPAPRLVEMVALDYAFQAPTTLPVGRTTFRFTNKGRVAHELNIGLLKRGVTAQQLTDAMNSDRPLGELRESAVGVLFSAPGAGAPATLTTDLLPGRAYMVICILKDGPDAKRHVAMGMFSMITVGSEPAPTPTATAVDSVVGTDYAFVRYPRTVAPGRHRFAFSNVGKVRHEAYMVLLAPGATAQKLIEISRAGGDTDSLVAQNLGVLHSLAGTDALGLLEVDMLPGRDYVIVCNFSDKPDAPPHVMLGMFGSIHVTAARSRR